MFEVLFRASNKDTRAHRWAPDGQPFQCDRETAMARFHALLESGKHKVLVLGLPVAHVRIEDTSRPAPKGYEASSRVMLSQYVIDDEPAGPWAESRAA